ncbi:caspase family protein [Chitinophaga sp. S165]|uniref:caspase family protein n=1 Tax=Chitinophaga sp. S165 TaxID=2135462 RepID=UPI000D712BBA|nr:caspase family protein [Chitinophaga sp. S165]PWV56011.1 caspase domain-containing protein [Chitinophaga sp. S165]
MSNNNDHTQEARKAIQSFVDKYAQLYPNGDHVELIQMAAFPIAVTVHLLYQIWANFGTFMKNGASVKLHALAVNDCIQSNIFRQTGPDLFEMDANVRQCLLQDLRANRGNQFVKEELAAFLYQYSRHNTQGSAWRNYYDAQQWAAVMEVNTRGAAEQILSSLAQELQKKNTSRGLGIVNLITALEKDNKQFSGLLQKALNKPESLTTEPAGVTSKRIVLTDQVVDGRQPVKINLPGALSKKLKTIVKKETSTIDDKNNGNANKTYGLFIELGDDIIKTEITQIKNLFIEKEYIQPENVSILFPRSENPTSEVRELVNKYLSLSKEGDTMIIYARYGPHVAVNPGLTPKILNDLITSQFPNLSPDVICMLEGDNILSEWYFEIYSTFSLIIAGYGINEKKDESLFKSVLASAANDITYAQFYSTLLQEFLIDRTSADIFSLPHLIPGALNWDNLLFSRTTSEAIDEAKKMLIDMGRGPGSENSIIELHEIISEGIREQGRQKTMALLKIFFLHQQEKIVKCCWLLQKEYDYDMEGMPGVSSRTILWTHFFDAEGNKGQHDITGLVNLLLETNVLFLGLGPQLLSPLHRIRLKTILDICRGRRILLYYIVEEEFEWGLLNIDADDLSLGGAILSDYISKEGRGSFLKIVYKEIEDMIGREQPKEDYGPGQAYGIFVGIDQYMDKNFNLHASVSDANKMLEVLTHEKLLAEDNKRLFHDNEATRDNVADFFRKVLFNAKSNDTIIFYFSGHSSNQQTNSALFFHDLDVSSEYTSQAENGILTDFEFKQLVLSAPNNPTIILILDTHGGSRHWLDENNPKHFSLMATHLEEKCYELNGIGGMLTDALAQHLRGRPRTMYIDLYKAVLEHFLNLANEGNQWQTPLFVVHKDHWKDILLPKIEDVGIGVMTTIKNYEDLQAIDALQCLYYSQAEAGIFTFYNQLKFALHEKRVDLEHVNTWSAIDKSFSVHNRFPDMIFIGLKQSMYAYEPRYNIEKLLTIAYAMEIPVYFILEDESEADPSVYKDYPLLPADRRPVISGEDVNKLIQELEGVTGPLIKYLKPEEEDYEPWGMSIGITHYENLPGLPAGVHNARRFSDWLSGALKNKIKRDHCFTYLTGSDVQVQRSDIDKTIRRLVSMAKENKKRALYIYLCGYMPRNSDDLLLASWSAERSNAIISITPYLNSLSNAGFARVVVFAEYIPVDFTFERSPKLFSLDSAHLPAPSCVYQVPLRVNDNIPYENNSIVLDGLYGEAAVNNSHTITTSSLRDYIDKRFELEGIDESPNFDIVNSETKYFTIADLDPKIRSSTNTRAFKHKWILIAGTGKDRLSQPEWMMSNALARELAKAGYGIITGGWPGVDAVAAEAYAIQLAEERILDKRYLQQVILETQEPVYNGGLIIRVANETLWYETVLGRAYALVMIGGLGGTYISYENAEKANVPVIPVGATGGDAARAFREMEKRRLLPRHLLNELNRPVNNYDDAERIAAAICGFLDERLDNQLNQNVS